MECQLDNDNLLDLFECVAIKSSGVIHHAETKEQPPTGH